MQAIILGTSIPKEKESPLNTERKMLFEKKTWELPKTLWATARS